MKPLVGAIVVDLSEMNRKLAVEIRASALRDALEDAIDVRDACEVLARIESGEETTIPWSDVKVQLGL